MAAHRYWRIYIEEAYNAFVGAEEIELRESVSGSDATGSGTASASSYYNPEALTPAKAFDDNTASSWASDGGAMPQWIAYDFGASNDKDIVEFSYRTRSSSAQSPKDLKLQYSDNGSDWSTLYTIIDTPGWTTSETRVWSDDYYDLSGVGYKQAWRINATSNNGGAVVAIVEMELRDEVSGTDLCTGGTATASTVFSASFLASYAFDDGTTNLWAASATTGWLRYEFASVVEPKQLALTGRTGSDVNQMPNDFTLEFWDGGGLSGTWVVALTVENITWSSGEVKTWTLPTLALSGVSGTGAVGTVTDSVEGSGTALTGVSGTGAIGTAGVDHTAALTSATHTPHRHWRIYITEAYHSFVGAGEIELRESAGGADATGSGTASASTFYAPSSLTPAKAFANDGLASGWASDGSAPPQWIAYDFGAGNEKIIVELSYGARDVLNGNAQTPKDFALQYSDDASAWTTLFGVNDTPSWSVAEIRTWSTGVSGTGAIGTAGVTGAAALTGVTGTGAIGSVTIDSADVTLALTSVSGTGVTGTVAPALDAILTGVSGTGVTGTVAPALDVALTGVAGEGAVGTVTVPDDSALTGVSGEGVIGSVTPSLALALTGVSGEGAVGSAAPDLSAPLTATAADAAVGTVVPSITVPTTGVSGEGAVGSVTAPAELIGVEGTGAAGTVTVGVATPLTGVAGEGAVGTAVQEHSNALAGAAGVGAVGTATPATTTAVTGSAGTGEVGSVAVGVVVPLAGASAAVAVGTPRAEHDNPLAGVAAVGAEGSIQPPSGLSGVIAGAAVGSVGMQRELALTQAAAVGAVGTASVEGTTAVSGMAAGAAVGGITPATSVSLSQVAGVGAVGSMEYARSITGVATGVAVGSVAPQVSVALTGVSAAGSAGQMIPAGQPEYLSVFLGTFPQRALITQAPLAMPVLGVDRDVWVATVAREAYVMVPTRRAVVVRTREDDVLISEPAL